MINWRLRGARAESTKRPLNNRHYRSGRTFQRSYFLEFLEPKVGVTADAVINDDLEWQPWTRTVVARTAPTRWTDDGFHGISSRDAIRLMMVVVTLYKQSRLFNDPFKVLLINRVSKWIIGQQSNTLSWSFTADPELIFVPPRETNPHLFRLSRALTPLTEDVISSVLCPSRPSEGFTLAAWRYLDVAIRHVHTLPHRIVFISLSDYTAALHSHYTYWYT